MLAAGRYYWAVALDNTTGTLYFSATSGSNVGLVRQIGVAQMAAAFPLPATITPAVMASASVPIIGHSLRTLVA